ncbi:MAG: hypothetical protein Ta2E_02630 [Mycoplasmoidaceae bacterium]|nr:MAG: hypothetical protein Ta2E_02630 [Mycoplasmoidaceae bacterium]
MANTNVNLSFNIEGFEQYLKLIHPTGGAKNSYMRVVRNINFKELFCCYSINEIMAKWKTLIEEGKFKTFIKKSPSYDVKGFVKATRGKIIDYYNWIENNNGTLEVEKKLPKKQYSNIKRKVIFKIINNKKVVLSSKVIKDSLKKNAKYLCRIDNKDICRYFKDIKDNNYVEVHHIIPLNMQEKYNKINLDVVQNMICLCSFHHRAIHFGNEQVVKDLLQTIWDAKKNELLRMLPKLTLDDLKTFY